MVMPDTARRYTVDEVLGFPEDGNRYELADGELLVTPAPTQRHQRVLGRLHLALETYLAPYADVAVTFFSRADVLLSPDDHVQPDLFVVPAADPEPAWRPWPAGLSSAAVFCFH